MTAPLVIVADPSWAFGDKLPGKTRGAAMQYSCMSVAAHFQYIFPFCAADNAVLFLWRVAAMQPEALELCRLLGFTIKAELVWEKLTRTGKPWFGMGRYVRASHEVCLIATRGRAFPEVRSVRSRFAAPVREHSRKPEAFYALVEAMYPNSPKVELYARTPRAGWTQDGAELGKFEMEAV